MYHLYSLDEYGFDNYLLLAVKALYFCRDVFVLFKSFKLKLSTMHVRLWQQQGCVL